MAKDKQPQSPTPIGEIAQGPSKLDRFLEKNQLKLLLLVVLLILGVSGWIIFKGLREARYVRAGESLLAAQDIGDLRKVIDEFGSTPAAGSATLELATRQWEDGQEGESIQTLRQFIESMPEHPAQPSARLALANRLLERDEPGEATALLKDLASDPRAAHLAPFALLRLGDLARADGDDQAAEDYYTRARDLFPVSGLAAQGRQLLASRIALVGVEPPVKVDPPPPPETTPESSPPSESFRPPLLPPGSPPHLPDATPPAPVVSPPVQVPGRPQPAEPPTDLAPPPTTPAPADQTAETPESPPAPQTPETPPAPQTPETPPAPQTPESPRGSESSDRPGPPPAAAPESGGTSGETAPGGSATGEE